MHTVREFIKYDVYVCRAVDGFVEQNKKYSANAR